MVLFCLARHSLLWSEIQDVKFQKDQVLLWELIGVSKLMTL